MERPLSTVRVCYPSLALTLCIGRPPGAPPSIFRHTNHTCLSPLSIGKKTKKNLNLSHYKNLLFDYITVERMSAFSTKKQQKNNWLNWLKLFCLYPNNWHQVWVAVSLLYILLGGGRVGSWAAACARWPPAPVGSEASGVSGWWVSGWGGLLLCCKAGPAGLGPGRLENSAHPRWGNLLAFKSWKKKIPPSEKC